MVGCRSRGQLGRAPTTGAPGKDCTPRPGAVFGGQNKGPLRGEKHAYMHEYTYSRDRVCGRIRRVEIIYVE